MDSEQNVVKQGKATLLRGLVGIGGSLTLTNTSLDFRAHRFNADRAPLTIPLREVECVGPGWTKFLGVLPIWLNAVVLKTTDEVEYRLTVFRCNRWVEAISSEREALTQGTRPGD